MEYSITSMHRNWSGVGYLEQLSLNVSVESLKAANRSLSKLPGLLPGSTKLILESKNSNLLKFITASNTVKPFASEDKMLAKVFVKL